MFKRLMKRLVVAAVVSVGLVACATPRILLPPKSTGAPCGYQWHPCMNGDMQFTGYCCAQGYSCGGDFPNVGAPAGTCQFVGATFTTW